MRLLKKKIITIIEKSNTCFSAYAIGYFVITAGNTIPEHSKNIVEALILYYRDQKVKVIDTNLDSFESPIVCNTNQHSQKN